jgi:hypothetical protein
MRAFVSAREGGGEREREGFVWLQAGISYFLNVLLFWEENERVEGRIVLDLALKIRFSSVATEGNFLGVLTNF